MRTKTKKNSRYRSFISTWFLNGKWMFLHYSNRTSNAWGDLLQPHNLPTWMEFVVLEDFFSSLPTNYEAKSNLASIFLSYNVRVFTFFSLSNWMNSGGLSWIFTYIILLLSHYHLTWLKFNIYMLVSNFTRKKIGNWK